MTCLHLPTRLGAFAITERLGHGGMGEVWRGRHETSHLPVAVKVLRPDDRWTGGGAELFRREVRATASMHHPAVVHVLDYGLVSAEAARASGGRLTSGAPWMAMELCSGGTLQGYRGALGWPRIRPVLLTLLDALAHAHARGFVHRDVKPANVLIGTPLDTRPGIKLSDFGIARIDHPTQDLAEAEFAGSAPYSAPEQLVGPVHEIGPGTDLFGLGCLAWALLTGDPPHSGASLPALVSARRAGRLPEFVPVDPVPDGFVHWLRRLLAPASGDRFECAADAAWALVRLEPNDPDEEALLASSPNDALAASGTLTGLLSGAEDPLTVAATHTFAATRLGLDGLRRGLGSAPWAPDEGAVRAGRTRPSRPPLPEDWRRLHPAPPAAALLGAGLGLFPFRTVPLAGREAERDLLWRALHRVSREGTAGAVVVRGAAGVGKSRLVGWICERAHELGAASVYRASHGATPGPADGLPGMLRRRFRLRGTVGDEAGPAVRPQLERRGLRDPNVQNGVLELVAPGSTTPEARAALLSTPEARWKAVADLVAADARRRPVIVWLDDAQWGEDALGFARQCLRRRQLDRAPVLLLLTVRDDLPATTGRLEDVGALLALPGCEALSVGPLDDAERGELVANLLGLTDESAREITARAEGNPLFTVQLVEHQVRQGQLVVGKGGFQPADGEPRAVPDDLRSMWAERFDAATQGLAAPAAHAVEIAAALGVEFDPGLWARAAGLGEEGMAAVTAALLEACLVVPVEERLRFVHGMARESIEQAARAAGRWAPAHAACAAALEGSRVPADVERRGLHILAAGTAAAAIDDLLAAVRWRKASGEPREALRAAEALATAHEQAGTDAGAEALLQARLDRLELLRNLRRDRPGDTEALDGLLASAQLGGHLRVAALVRCEIGRRLRDRGDLGGASSCLRTAFAQAEEADDDAAIGSAGLALGWAMAMAGEHQDARRIFRRAAAAGGRSGDLLGMARAYMGLCESYVQDGRLERASHFGERALEAAQGRGAARSVGDAAVHLAAVDLAVAATSPDPEPALRRAGQRIALARREHDRGGAGGALFNTLNLAGEVARRRGLWEEATEAYREALAVAEAFAPGWTWMPRLNLAVLEMEGGRFADARRPIEAAGATLRASGRAAMLQWIDLMMLPVLIGEGDRAGLGVALDGLAAGPEGWYRPQADCRRAVEWASAMARREGWTGEAERLDRLHRSYHPAGEG